MTNMDNQNDENSTPPKTKTSLWTILAHATLLVDAYLVLASIASQMMKNTYRTYLPPFDRVDNIEGARLFTLIVATWTAVLAMGCLKMRRVPSDSAYSAGIVWVVLLLSVVWLMYLTPAIIDVSRNLFLYGP